MSINKNVLRLNTVHTDLSVIQNVKKDVSAYHSVTAVFCKNHSVTCLTLNLLCASLRNHLLYSSTMALNLSD